MKKFSSTMKASSRRSSRRQRLMLIAVATLVAALLLFAVPRVLGYVAAVVMVPVVHVQHWLVESSAALPTYLRDRTALLTENTALKTELSTVRDARLKLQELTAENEALRDLFDAAQEPRRLAEVVSQPPALPYDVLVIDKGSRDGIIKNAPVYTLSDRVIGVVSEVYPASAVVVLVTMPDFKSTVFIMGPNIYTTATGQGGGTLRVEVPQGIPLEAGNLVLLPAFAGGIFGEVVSVDAHETRPAQYGYVSLSTALQEINMVNVGTRPLMPVSFEAARAAVDEKIQTLTTVPVPAGVLVEPPDVASTTATSTATTSQAL